MRYYGLFLVLLFLFSCSAKEKAYKESVETNNTAIEAEGLKVKMSGKSYESILSEKLYNYVDLLRLKSNHPDFEEDVLMQLQDLSKGQILNIVKNPNDKIENIKIEYPPKKVSDSLKEFKLKYELYEKSKKIEDSVFAIIKTRKVNIDGEVVESNKIVFYK